MEEETVRQRKHGLAPEPGEMQLVWSHTVQSMHGKHLCVGCGKGAGDARHHCPADAGRDGAPDGEAAGPGSASCWHGAAGAAPGEAAGEAAAPPRRAAPPPAAAAPAALLPMPPAQAQGAP